MECVEGKSTSEGNLVKLSENSCEKDFDNSSLDSKLLKKNHSGFIEELDFEDEPSDMCQNMSSSEFNLHVSVSEETDSVKEGENSLKEEIEVGELSETEVSQKDQISNLTGEIIGGNCSDANDDVEEGEVKDDSSSYDMTNTVCRFFLRGKCVWGSNCRFFHVTDKGLYNMFDNVAPRKSFDPPPVNIIPKEFIKPVCVKIPQPREFVEVASSGWDRALNEAKQAILRSKARREEDDEFEDKKLYNSFGDDISHFKKFSSAEKQFPNRNVNNLVPSKPCYKNYDSSLSFKVLRTKSESPADARLSRKREVKYIKKSDYSEKWQDPWRRSKSPEKRRKRSRSSSSESLHSEHSSIVSSHASSTSCSCSAKSFSPKSISHKRVHSRNDSVSHNSRYRSVSRSASRSRSRRTSWSSISSSSLSSVSSDASFRSENLKRTSLKDREEIYRSRQHPKLNVVKNKSRYSPSRSASRYSRSCSPPRYSPAIKSPLSKRHRRNSSDMSISPVSDYRSSNYNRRRVVSLKADNVSEKTHPLRTSKKDLAPSNGLVPRVDNSKKITNRSLVPASSTSVVQLKQTVGMLKVQANKWLSEDKSPQHTKREKSNIILDEKKTRDNNSTLPKRGADLSCLQNLSSKQAASSKNPAIDVKQKITKVKKIDVDVSSFHDDLLKYHNLTKTLKVVNNLSAKVEKPPTNPISNPSVTPKTEPKQEISKQKATMNEPKRKITLNLHSKNDHQIKLSEDCLKVKLSKKSNLPPQTTRRDHLLKQLKAVEEAIARKKSTI